MEGSNIPSVSSATSPVTPQEHSWLKIIEFLNSNLRSGSPWSIADEYPSALGKSQVHNMRVIIDQGKVVSHAVLRPMILKTPVGALKAGGIGSVVTSQDHRNQGHSTQIIESCIEAARAADCDFAILWTDLFDFYRRLDFELAGSEVSVLIDRDLLPATGFTFHGSTRIAAESILRVFSQHTVSSHRTVDDVRTALSIPNSRVFTAWDTTGKLAAYAIEGKGADLDGYIHEWGGSVTALLSLLTHMRASQKRDLRLIMPSHATGLLSKLNEMGCREHRGYLGMIRILAPDSLFSKIKRHARGLGISDLIFEERDGKFVFGKGSNVYSTDSHRDLTQLLFGPEKPSEMNRFDAETAKAFDRVLPLPVWIWGWDSV